MRSGEGVWNAYFDIGVQKQRTNESRRKVWGRTDWCCSVSLVDATVASVRIVSMRQPLHSSHTP